MLCGLKLFLDLKKIYDLNSYNNEHLRKKNEDRNHCSIGININVIY